MTVPLGDDPTIGDQAPLWRRIPPWHVVFDANLGRWRPSSAAFDDHPNGSPMSVILGDEVLAAGRQSDSTLTGLSDFSLVSFLAGVARSLGQIVLRKPLNDEPAHAEVFDRKTQAMRKTLARQSVWIVAPVRPEPFEGNGPPRT